jgi:ubiquinone/menaquinone biosynthesis C-methylase UbiE
LSNLNDWERAYLIFESPSEEISKFKSRLQKLGIRSWNRDLKILEIFCGRGGGLHAWEELGFTDLSEHLISQYKGPAHCYVADARALPFSESSFDVVSVQGGLHHLSSTEDLRQALLEIHRVLRPHGKLIVVEPWLTPFLQFVHWICRFRFIRKISKKLNALATMIENEQKDYYSWLERPKEILQIIQTYVTLSSCSISFGKIRMLGIRCERS